MINFNRGYFIASVILFLIEILIAQYAHDNFIRPYFGDFLVVLLLYCSAKTFLKVSVSATSLSVLLFSFTIEFLQSIHIVTRIGLADSKLANTLIGNSFSWADILAYTLGVVFIYSVEYLRFGKRKTNSDIHNQNRWLFL